jgi:hypothetical protein
VPPLDGRRCALTGALTDTMSLGAKAAPLVPQSGGRLLSSSQGCDEVGGLISPIVSCGDLDRGIC